MHFGAPFPHSFAALLQEKARTPSLIRSIALEGHKFTPKELFDAGLVDELAEGGTKGVVHKATELAKVIGQNASTGVWGLIKVSKQSSPMLSARGELTSMLLIRRRSCTQTRWSR